MHARGLRQHRAATQNMVAGPKTDDSGYFAADVSWAEKKGLQHQWQIKEEEEESDP